MKRFYTLLLALCVAVSALAQNGKDLYKKYSDLPEVSAVYISPAMFRIIGRLPDVSLEDKDVNLSPIIKSMTGFYLLSCETEAVGGKLYNEVSRLVNGGKYELLLEAKEDGTVTRLYSVGGEKEISSLVFLSKDGAEVTYIGIDGRMDRAELENILAEAAGN